MTTPIEPAELKSCCAAIYQSDFARMLLGDSFHPGGQRLTARLGEHLGLGPGVRVLDVASGKGESAIFVARQFGCHVVGVDFGRQNVVEANSRATAAQVDHLVSFVEGDAERLDFPDAGFDAVICECAFCTFPDKRAAASEFARVLRAGGRIGMSDLTRSGSLPQDLDGLLAWIACIADARRVEEYAGYLEGAGFNVTTIESHNNALAELARDIQNRLLGIEIMVRLKKLDLPGADFEQAKQLARAASKAIREGLLGYGLIVAHLCARKSECL
ncbi:MAG TPA: methyltransferase domain-containing protein [Bryobacteraceae bacterium]|jgi:ubiquinone/menaquinone biosynthesis C-methylase UbiE|nr:methyltransferase domain-containing protein [Bryobacteraceae bacterium]